MGTARQPMLRGPFRLYARCRFAASRSAGSPRPGVFCGRGCRFASLQERRRADRDAAVTPPSRRLEEQTAACGSARRRPCSASEAARADAPARRRAANLRPQCYFPGICVIKLTPAMARAPPRRAFPPRAADHGHPLPPRPRHRRRGDGGPARAIRAPPPSARSCACSRTRVTCGTRKSASASSTCRPSARHAARKSALRHLVETFFDGSAEKTVAALLGGEGARSRTKSSIALPTWSRRRGRTDPK